jgi:hypothetical protein
MKVNYTTNESGEITSFTIIPFDETKPSMDISDVDYRIICLEMSIKTANENQIKQPTLSPLLQPKINQWEAELNQLKGVSV